MVWKFNQLTLRSYCVFDFPPSNESQTPLSWNFIGNLYDVFTYMEKLILDISRYEKVTLVTLGGGQQK